MTNRIPADAFSFYVGLGPGRSYQAVADRYGVSKQAVVRVASRERWQPRLEEIERKAREQIDKKAVESLESMNDRHLRTLQVIQKKALEALKSMHLNSAMDAVRALDMCIAKERLVRGEPNERSAISIEDKIRDEYDRWLVRPGDAEQHQVPELTDDDDHAPTDDEA